jgi:hypothetical protein
MRLTKIFICVLAVSLFSFTSIEKNKPGQGEWRFLADKKVGFGVDHDVIHFSNWGDNVRQIKLKVTDGPLKMYDMKVHFDNGTTQDIQLRFRFVQGSESRVIDLDGGLRRLDKIEFRYETKGFMKGKAQISVYGRN